jgi:hypothetical protein
MIGQKVLDFFSFDNSNDVLIFPEVLLELLLDLYVISHEILEMDLALPEIFAKLVVEGSVLVAGFGVFVNLLLDRLLLFGDGVGGFVDLF